MSSTVLGDETVQVREEATIVEFDDDWFISVKGVQGTPHDNLLKRSMIWIAISSMSSSMIHDNILAEGVICHFVKPMGGLLHLISFKQSKTRLKWSIASGWISDSWQ